MKRLRDLEAENRRLKGLVADLSVDKQILQEVLQKSDLIDPTVNIAYNLWLSLD